MMNGPESGPFFDPEHSSAFNEELTRTMDMA